MNRKSRKNVRIVGIVVGIVFAIKGIIMLVQRKGKVPGIFRKHKDHQFFEDF